MTKKKEMSDDFTGITLEKLATHKKLGIHRFPARKQWCLYEEDAHGIYILAFIKEDADAEKIADWLVELATGNGVVEE